MTDLAELKHIFVNVRIVLIILTSFLMLPSKSEQTENDPDDMTSYFPAFKKRGHRLWWRSSLLFSCIIIGFLLYLESEYRYLGEGKLFSMSPALSSSASSKVNDQIKALQEKVGIFQKRYVRK
jgi:hypothetical protein